MFKIEKGIKQPSYTSTYPLLEMDIGDSFLVLCEEKDRYKTRGRIASACVRKGVRPKKFSIRQVDNGIRCWRIK